MFGRGATIVQICVGFVKPKFLVYALKHVSFLGLMGCWILTLLFVYRGAHALMQGDRPTLPEVDQHLKYNDQRITDLHDEVNDNFKKLDADRLARKDVSDARYKDLADRLHSIEHDVSFMYGGGIIGTTLVSILLTLNIIKVTKTEDKIKMYPTHLNRTDDVDLTQAMMYSEALQDLVRRELDKRRAREKVD